MIDLQIPAVGHVGSPTAAELRRVYAPGANRGSRLLAAHRDSKDVLLELYPVVRRPLVSCLASDSSC